MKRFCELVIFIILLLVFSCTSSIHDLETEEYIEVVKTTLTAASSVEECKRRIDSFGFKETDVEITTVKGFMIQVTTYKDTHKRSEITLKLFSNLEDGSFFFTLVSKKNMK